MKIIGGSFGLSGRLSIAKGGLLAISGDKSAQYPKASIANATAKVEKQRKFGFIGFFIGAILLSLLFGLFLGPLGVAIGIGLSLLGSFYSKKQNIVDLTFDDGKSLIIVGSKSDVKTLLALS